MLSLRLRALENRLALQKAQRITSKRSGRLTG
jgi:hypothetical protein